MIPKHTPRPKKICPAASDQTSAAVVSVSEPLKYLSTPFPDPSRLAPLKIIMKTKSVGRGTEIQTMNEELFTPLKIQR